MKRKSQTSLLAFAAGSLATAGIALLIAAGPDHSQDHGDLDNQNMDTTVHQPDTDMGEAPEFDMMAEMTKLATPGVYHQALGIMVGDWSAKSSFSMGPDAPPTEGDGTMTVKWVLGKRYVQSHFHSEVFGQPFEGIGFIGYDIAHEQYVSSWMDTMSTKITHMKGGEELNDALVLYGTSTTPMGDNPMKMVTTFTDPNTWVDTFFDKMPGSDEWIQSGTITYTRIIEED